MLYVLQAGNQKFCVSKLEMTPDVIKMWSAIVGFTATGLKMEKDFPKDRPLASSTASMESEHTCKSFIEHLTCMFWFYKLCVNYFIVQYSSTLNVPACINRPYIPMHLSYYIS